MWHKRTFEFKGNEKSVSEAINDIVRLGIGVLHIEEAGHKDVYFMSTKKEDYILEVWTQLGRKKVTTEADVTFYSNKEDTVINLERSTQSILNRYSLREINMDNQLEALV